MQNISEWALKSKRIIEEILADWGIYLIIILIALASFGLGRLSMTEKVRPPVAITSTAVANVPLSIPSGGMIIASKSGSAYHFPWCAGAINISEKNKVWFNSETDAQKAGYSPAKKCKGLK
ncbi:MAG TPA: hypothetical protein VJH69_02720 [Candidatus Paceibacterota bacterium]